jgi:hypothetical protein
MITLADDNLAQGPQTYGWGDQWGGGGYFHPLYESLTSKCVGRSSHIEQRKASLQHTIISRLRVISGVIKSLLHMYMVECAMMISHSL